MLIASQHKKKDKMLHEKTLRSSLRKAYELPLKKKKGKENGKRMNTHIRTSSCAT